MPERRRRLQIAGEVKRARAARGLTQAQLAEQVGVHQQTIGNLERGTVDVSADVLGRVEEALGISLSPQRMAAAIATQVVSDHVERRLAELSESDGLVFVGELLRWVSAWTIDTPVPPPAPGLHEPWWDQGGSAS